MGIEVLVLQGIIELYMKKQKTDIVLFVSERTLNSMSSQVCGGK